MTTRDDPAPAARVLIVGAGAADLEATLRAAGHEVSVAASGQDAVAAAAERSPDLALIDLGLEGPTGALDAAAAVGGHSVPFIYVLDESAEDPSPQTGTTMRLMLRGWMRR